MIAVSIVNYFPLTIRYILDFAKGIKQNVGKITSDSQ